MSKRLGLIVGVNQYQDPLFRPLQYAENDARALAQWIANAKGGKWDPSHIQHVQGIHATKELIESLIVQMCISLAEPGDLALFYFAGHAFIDERDGEGYLALANTRSNDPTTGIHLPSFINQVLLRSPISHVVIILDCFQSGRPWGMLRRSPYDMHPLLNAQQLQQLQEVGNRLFLCSCRGNEFASEVGESGLGLFVHRTILGLCGPALDPATRTATLQGLYAYLLNALGEQHRPQLMGREYSPSVLVGDLPPPPSPQQMSPLAPSPSQQLRPSPGTGTATGAQAAHYATGVLPQSGQVAAATASQVQPSSGKLSASPAEQQRKQQAEAILQRAREFLQAQNYTEAYRLVEQVLQVFPLDSSALILKGQMLGTMGRYQEALAIVDQLMRIDSNNPLAWSMQAVLLSNMGQFQAAYQAIEHSLELDVNNPETYAIKTSIMASMAAAQDRNNNLPPSRLSTPDQKRGGPLSVFLHIFGHILGVVLGVGGLLLPIYMSHLSLFIALAAASLGLALICTIATRGAYLYGWTRLLLTLLLSQATGGLLAGLYRFAYTRIVNMVLANQGVLIPILFLVTWIALAATLPLLLAIVGFISGVARGVRKS